MTASTPSDVLNIIFLLLADRPNEGLPTTNSLDTTESPWSLSQVCQRWREVCHSNPILWSYIAIPKSGEMSSSVQYPKNLLASRFRLSEQIRHSSSLPLEISAGGLLQGGVVNDLFMQLLWPSRHRWRRATIDFGRNCPLDGTWVGAVHADSASFPLLEHLQLNFQQSTHWFDSGRAYPGTQNVNTDTVLGLFSNAPNLKSAHFHSFPSTDAAAALFSR